MGDLSGDPVFTIANVVNYRFNADIEQQIFDAGLYLISMCAPGCGRTDPAPKQANRLDYLSDDANAVLDQLGIASCPMMAYNASSPVCYAVASRSPERINHFIHLAAVAPIRFLHSDETISPWVSGILRAGKNHPAMKKVLFFGAMKAWAMMGARQFMRLQISSNSADSKYTLRPENMREFEHALKTATQNGIAYAAEDLSLTFEDWFSDVEDFPFKITAMHGVQDELVNIQMIRNISAALTDKIELIEIADCGLSMVLSHTDEVISLLRKVIETYQH